MHAAMVKIIGAHETNANNHNFITSWYGFDGPWCDMAISYAAYHSGNQGPVCFNSKHAYTVEHAQVFKNHGQWHAMTNGVHNSGIRAGDIVFFDWSGGVAIGSIDHVGYVESVNGSVVHTIEGNISNVCGRFSRTASVIAGFGRPKYKPAPVSPLAKLLKPKPKPAHAVAKYEPFPGAAFFAPGRRSPIITAMGKRLVAEKCSAYTEGPGPEWTDADKASYARWQRKCGFSGADANGIPGQTSWDLLKVPNV